MLHPSYTDLMKVVNSEVEEGNMPVVNSRYSIVLATSKRARQLIGGELALVDDYNKKPLSVAVEELNNSKIRIISDEEKQQKEAEKKLKESQEAAKDEGSEETLDLSGAETEEAEV